VNQQAALAALRERGQFRKSSKSQGQTNCVGVNGIPDWVGVQDTKNPAGPILAFTATAWSRFLAEHQRP
jgi:hypothetical protein